LYRRYKDRVEFLAIYVREAHPVDGWRMASNDRAGIRIEQPRARDERLAVAQKCCSALEISMPLLVDEMDDRVGHAYSGMPDRLYLIDRDGRVAYKGGRGPFGFKPGELEQSLALLLLDQGSVATQSKHGIPVLTDTEAWKRLPPAEEGAGQPLPAWARALAETLPRTTAVLLELDYLHRARSPLDPRLRGQLRWVAARANRCAASEAQAAADLRRAGLEEADFQAMAGDHAGLPAAEREALQFARKLTVAANTVTDAEVARLVEHYGDKHVVAMVLLLAYASFQDRLVLSLGLPPEAGDPRPALAVRFAKGTKVVPASRPPHLLGEGGPAAEGTVSDPEWLQLDFTQLQKEMEDQRAREPRIRVPSWDEVRKGLPADYPANRPLRIRWSLVCLGYQPELAAGWSACLRTFQQEARQDRVLEETLFWVVTRSLHCFY
jgi:alkylhydroperoxidase family enzyme